MSLHPTQRNGAVIQEASASDRDIARRIAQSGAGWAMHAMIPEFRTPGIPGASMEAIVDAERRMRLAQASVPAALRGRTV